MDWLRDVWVLREIVLPVLDVLILAYLFYKVYQIIAETRAIAALKGLFLILLVTLLANLLHLETLKWMLERFLGVAAIALIVLFQPELRRVLMKMGQGKFFSLYEDDRRYLGEVIRTVEFFSERRVGALIVFERGVGLRTYIETGTPLDAAVSFELLTAVFRKDSPLHDGAVVIEQKRIAAAACFLPLSTRSDLHRDLGTRHRAALGLSEETDAVVLVVSEETGQLSLAVDGKLRQDIKPERLQEHLEKLFNLQRHGPERKLR